MTQELWTVEGFLKKIGDEIKSNVETDMELVIDLKKYILEIQPNINCCVCGSKGPKEESTISITFADGDINNIVPTNINYICQHCTKYVEEIIARIKCSLDVSPGDFVAAHYLPNYDGECKNLHGHTWKTAIKVVGSIVPSTGLSIDFKKIKEVFKEKIINVLDHSYLNDFIYTPTAEALALWMWDQFIHDERIKGIQEISVWESEGVCATVSVYSLNNLLKNAISKVGTSG